MLQAKLDSRFPGNQFETGYWDHTLTRAIWTLPGQKEELLRTYQQELAARGKTGVESRLTPAVQFLTSDIGVSSAKVIALLEGGKTPIHIGSCVAVDHLNIPPQTGQQNGGNRSRVTVEMSPGVRLQVQAVE